MSFTPYKDQSGTSWLVDTDGIKQLIRSYVRATAVLHRSHLNYEKQDMGPLGLFFPLTLVTVQTNYDGLGSEVDAHAQPLINQILPQLTQSGSRAFQTLVGWRDATVNANEQFREMQVQASQQTNSALDRVQSSAKTWTNVARTVRDVSAGTLMVGASMLTGGAAVAAIGGASVLKGTFTFEDEKLAGKSTGEAVAAGTLELSTDVVVGFIGIGESSVLKQAIANPTAGARLAAGVLVFHGALIDGGSEFAKATIDGESVRQALIAAGVRAGVHIATAGVGAGLDSAFSSTRLSGLSFPVTVTKGSLELVSLSNLGIGSGISFGSDSLVKALSSVSTPDSGAWHQSLACTYIPMGNSDAIYVQQHALRPAKS